MIVLCVILAGLGVGGGGYLWGALLECVGVWVCVRLSLCLCVWIYVYNLLFTFIVLFVIIVRTPSKMRWYISRGYPWNKERKNYLMSSQQWLNVPMKQTQITFGTTFLRNRLSLNPTYYIGYINKVNTLIIYHKHRMYTLIQDSC